MAQAFAGQAAGKPAPGQQPGPAGRDDPGAPRRREQALALARPAQQLLRAGDAKGAAALFAKAADADPGWTEILLHLATAHQMAGDPRAEIAALDRLLGQEPRNLLALLLKGAAVERMGDAQAAGAVFNAALAVAPPFNTLPDDLKPLVRHAHEAVTRFRARYEEAMREELTSRFGPMQGRAFHRVRESLDIFLGKKEIFPQKPHVHYVPGLRCVQFYDREEFAWLPAIEAETAAIRDELLTVMAEDQGLVPYVEYPAGIPLDQWAELNHSLRWSVFHLKRDGHVVEENAARCPRTLAAIAGAPQPALPNRSPAAMFSILQPRTRIPPHTGVTNARLVVHIPLVIPEKCWFRVGNEVREWKVGEAFVFNDSIEHEAANDSDSRRAVLIFDIWNPDLTAEERELFGAMFAASDQFLGGPTGGTGI